MELKEMTEERNRMANQALGDQERGDFAMEERSALRRFTDKLYGGINLTWPGIVLYAVGAAVLTTVFLVLPVFKDTSFARMGETVEAWIFLALIIIVNGKSPLDSACKTFVFFLISQPLIYLMQVPFNWQDWGIFQYYTHWFIMTLCTFPAAYIGWYIKKKNWLSLLILMPLLVLLAWICSGGLDALIHQFPHLLVLVVFCVLQVILYLYAFTEKASQKVVGALVPAAVVVVLMLMSGNVDIAASELLPDDPVFTENAEVVVDDVKIADISISDTGKDSAIWVQAHAYGDTSFTVKDGDREYRYTISIYKDGSGTSQIDITPR